MEQPRKRGCVLFDVMVLGVALASCGNQTAKLDIAKPNIEWGVGVHPWHGLANANPDDWDDAFIKGRRVGTIAHLEVTFGELSLQDAEAVYDLKVPRARKIGMDVFMQINTFGTIPTDMGDFKNFCLALAAKYKPEYICIGQEINYVYDNNPAAAYRAFISELLELYRRVKTISPSTVCTPSFSYESVRAKHQEFLFDDFREIVPFLPITSYPLKAFDMYPGYLYELPKDIPPDYWNGSGLSDQDIFVTETGWSTDPHFRGSRQQQADYVEKVYQMVRSNPRIKKVVWIVLTDVVSESTTIDREYPGTMGFFTIDGKEKPAWSLISR